MQAKMNVSGQARKPIVARSGSISQAHESLQGRASGSAAVGLVGDNLGIVSGASRMSPELVKARNDKLTGMIVAQLADSPAWRAAAAEEPVQDSLRQMAAAALMNVLEKPKQAGRQDPALTLDGLAKLSNVVARLAEGRDGKTDFVAQSRAGPQAAVEALEARMRNENFSSSAPKPTPVEAGSRRDVSCLETAAGYAGWGMGKLGSGAAQLGSGIGYGLAALPRGLAWMGSKVHMLVAQQYLIQASNHAARDRMRSFSSATVGDEMSAWSDRVNQEVQANWRSKFTTTPESAKKFLKGFLDGRIAHVSSQAAVDALIETVPQHSRCAAAAVEAICDAAQYDSKNIAFWTGIVPILLSAPPSVLRHTYFTQAQIAMLQEGLWQSYQMDAPVIVPSMDSKHSKLTRESLVELCQLSPKHQRYGMALLQLDQASRTFEDFLASPMAVDPRFDGAQLDDLIEYVASIPPGAEGPKPEIVKDDKSFNAIEGAIRKGKSIHVPGFEDSAALPFPARGDSKASDSADSAVEKMGPGRPRLPRGALARDSGSEASDVVEPSQQAAWAPRGRPASTRLFMNRNTGRLIWRSSHHRGGTNKALSNKQRDLMHRPGKSWNHRLAVDLRRQRQSEGPALRTQGLSVRA